ncbi:hypothetical protein C8A00DRAFT_17686 [Chaetomidium leptoderma]|uniref:Uncharacterized protein n=1 Tax=Chaetomidium leptoderma TaxID=669021 RepID=A0AAN6VG55_9PEZI|nr:hypothetical protein C8A00DRAFT_17686 [Chaetomidium leptoderma]
MLGLTLIAGAAFLARGVFGEGVHFLNCGSFAGAAWPHTYISIVAYCANDVDCSDVLYTIPLDDACIMSSSTSPDFHQWATGTDQSCTFPSSGVTFSWNIPTEIGSLPVYSSAGTGSNGFKTFAGFKDDGLSGAKYDLHSCSKRYYYI